MFIGFIIMFLSTVSEYCGLPFTQSRMLGPFPGHQFEIKAAREKIPLLCAQA